MSKAIVAKYQRLVAIEEKAYKDQKRLLKEYGECNAKFKVGAVVWLRDDCNRKRYYRIIENYACVDHEKIRVVTRAIPTTRKGEKRGSAVFLGDVTLSLCEVVPKDAARKGRG